MPLKLSGNHMIQQANEHEVLIRSEVTAIPCPSSAALYATTSIKILIPATMFFWRVFLYGLFWFPVLANKDKENGSAIILTAIIETYGATIYLTTLLALSKENREITNRHRSIASEKDKYLLSLHFILCSSSSGLLYYDIKGKTLLPFVALSLIAVNILITWQYSTKDCICRAILNARRNLFMRSQPRRQQVISLPPINAA